MGLRWKEKDRVERMQERYIKWVLGVKDRTPGYLVREEIQREKLRGREEELGVLRTSYGEEK